MRAQDRGVFPSRTLLTLSAADVAVGPGHQALEVGAATRRSSSALNPLGLCAHAERAVQVQVGLQPELFAASFGGNDRVSDVLQASLVGVA